MKRAFRFVRGFYVRRTGKGKQEFGVGDIIYPTRGEWPILKNLLEPVPVSENESVASKVETKGEASASPSSTKETKKDESKDDSKNNEEGSVSGKEVNQKKSTSVQDTDADILEAVSQLHAGGGYYDIPGVGRVHGKADAIAAYKKSLVEEKNVTKTKSKRST